MKSTTLKLNRARRAIAPAAQSPAPRLQDVPALEDFDYVVHESVFVDFDDNENPQRWMSWHAKVQREVSPRVGAEVSDGVGVKLWITANNVGGKRACERLRQSNRGA